MPTTKKEQALLKRLAEAYAFIIHIRRRAIANGEAAYIMMTEGIEDAIERQKKEHPRIFTKYFNRAQNTSNEPK